MPRRPYNTPLSAPIELPKEALTETDQPLRLSNDRMVWVDLEMTGLEPRDCVIVEVAALVTDAQLNILGEGIDLVVSATEDQLATMNDYVRNMHTKSGLLEEIQASTITLEQAEDAVIELINRHCRPGHLPPLAGNSIATDRSFIHHHMPRLDAALHYRMIDVSSIKELARRWFPHAYHNQPAKDLSHRALTDIIESVRELDYYQRALFVDESAVTSEASRAAARASAQRFFDYLGDPPPKQ